MKLQFIYFLIVTQIILLFCTETNITENRQRISCEKVKQIITGAEQVQEYLPLLTGKRVGLVVNQTSRIKSRHLVDSLSSLKINITSIFALEHGIRGDIEPGGEIKDSKDEKTGIPVISLYGKNKKPTPGNLANVDILVFDIQDIGARFYTYISSLFYIMQSCAENQKKLLVLDRPNPNGDQVDGPVLDMEYKSFVGILPVPVLHGLTIAELTLMINGESWLGNNLKCELHIVPVKNYSHEMHYSLPVKPSPNLPDDLSVRLYPSLCFFEATNFSIGRGTNFPFKVIGFPGDSSFGAFSFTPRRIDGNTKYLKNADVECFGEDLRNLNPDSVFFTIKYLVNFHNLHKKNSSRAFFSRQDWMNLLSGNLELQKQIEAGMTEAEIRKSWQPELNEYKAKREKYLLYADE